MRNKAAMKQTYKYLVTASVALPKTTFPIQVFAPFFVVLEEFLHHICQRSIIQLNNKMKHIR